MLSIVIAYHTKKTSSEPLYDEATPKSDNAERIEMEPNVLYGKRDPR